MDDKTFIARKAVDLDDLINRSNSHKTDLSEFIIENVVELSPEDYTDFTGDLLKDRDFIKENRDNMFLDKNGVWHCILVREKDGNGGVLVEAEGYDYARYTGYIPTCKGGINVLTDKIVEQIMGIRASGVTNMFDTNTVQVEANNKGYYELVIFIEEHKDKYARFILTGER